MCCSGCHHKNSYFSKVFVVVFVAVVVVVCCCCGSTQFKATISAWIDFSKTKVTCYYNIAINLD